MSNSKTIDPQKWDGSPYILETSEKKMVTMPNTPNGMVVLAFENLNPKASTGKITVVSGGSPTKILEPKSKQGRVSIYKHNFGANSVTITNISGSDGDKVRVMLIGPGFFKPGVLQTDGTSQSLLPIVEGSTEKRPLANSATATRSILQFKALQGVQSFLMYDGINPYVYLVNSEEEKTPTGYDGQSKNNNYDVSRNFDGRNLYVANLSSRAAATGSVTYQSLEG